MWRPASRGEVGTCGLGTVDRFLEVLEGCSEMSVARFHRGCTEFHREYYKPYKWQRSIIWKNWGLAWNSRKGEMQGLLLSSLFACLLIYDDPCKFKCSSKKETGKVYNHSTNCLRRKHREFVFQQRQNLP